LNRKL